MALFIAFEGIETSGKTTLISSLKEDTTFNKLGVSYKPEFLATPYSEKLITEALQKSSFLTEGLPFKYSSSFFYSLFLESRNVQDLIITDNSNIIIADRYIESIILYQGKFALEQPTAQNYLTLYESIITILNLFNQPVPNLTFYLKIDKQTLLQRFAVREKRNLTVSELSVMSHFIEIYDFFSTALPYCTIDGTMPREEIKTLVIEVIQARINKNG